jgi:hypothetical protein
MSDVNSDNDDLGGANKGSYFSSRPRRRLRIIREPMFSGADLLAFVVILMMVCGPLLAGVITD